ncbi:MAG: signal peptidase II [Cellulomonas sp.]
MPVIAPVAWWRTALVVIGVAAADLLSKAWALGSEPTTSTTGLVQLRHVTNSGASFGWGEQIPAVVLALVVVASVAVGWWWAKASGPVERVAVAAILGGALGNLADRIPDGAVTDWVHVGWYPATFNLADVAIRGGLVAALVAREVHHRRTRRTVVEAPQRSDRGVPYP